MHYIPRHLSILTLTCAFAVVLTAAIAPVASAGTFQAHPCGGDRAAPGWGLEQSGGNNGKIGYVNNCNGYVRAGHPGGKYFGLRVDATVPKGEWAGFFYNVSRPGVTMDSVAYTAQSTDGVVAIPFVQMCSTSTCAEQLATDSGCTVPGCSANWGLTNNGSRRIGAYMKCQTADPCGNSDQAYIYDFNITVRDDTSPALSVADGGTFRSGQWLRGSVTRNFTTGDAGSGLTSLIQTFEHSFANSQREDFATLCQRGSTGVFLTPEPCPTTWSPSTSIDTTKFTDGGHSVQTFSYDAAGNWAANYDNFKADNTRPGTPGAVMIADTTNGWRSVNDFDLSWTNSSEVALTTTASGIIKACVDVGPEANGNVPGDPAPVCVTGNNIAAISNLTLPGDGEWLAEVTVEDRAGNVSLVRTATLKLDTTIPDKAEGEANGWIARHELIGSYMQKWRQLPNRAEIESGICGYAFSVTDGANDDPGRTINLPGDVNQALVPADTPEGTNWAHTVAISCAGLSAGTIEHVVLPVDLTDPTPAVSGIPAGWTNQSLNVMLTGTDVLSGMTGAAPDYQVTEGAYLTYKLDDGAEQQVRGDKAAFAVSAEGEHKLNFSAVDLASNSGSGTAKIQIDKTAPSGVFELPDSDDPTRLVVAASDIAAGVTEGRIQYRPAGGGKWTMLETSKSGSDKQPTLTARMPDTQIPRGTYELRAVVVDRASNQGVIDRRSDGQTMIVTTPMRAGVLLAAGVNGTRRMCRGDRRFARCKGVVICKRASNAKPRCSRKDPEVIRLPKNVFQQAWIPAGKTALLKGYLRTQANNAITNAKISLYGQAQGGTEKPIGVAITDYNGNFAYRVPPGPSRTVRVVYAGTAIHEDAATSVQLGVSGKVNFRLSRKRIRIGKALRFTGRVLGCGESSYAAGKLVQIEFLNGTHWQAGPKLMRTRADGSFRASYRFKRISRPTVITFRVVLPAERGYLCAPSASKPRKVLVMP